MFFLKNLFISQLSRMSKTQRKVYVIGVGLTKFEKPGNRNWDYPDMGAEATTKALEDAGISYDLIEQVACGYVYVSRISNIIHEITLNIIRVIQLVGNVLFIKWE